MATIPKVTLLHIWRITSDLAHFSPETDGAVMEPLDKRLLLTDLESVKILPTQ